MTEPLITRHTKTPYVLRDLKDRPAWRWLGMMPKELAVLLLTGPCMLADWIVRHSPETLKRDELKIVVIGTQIDTTEQGLMWSTVSAMVGKHPGWIDCRVMGEYDRAQPILRRGAPPFATDRCRWVSRPLTPAGLQSVLADEPVDIIVVTRGTTTLPSSLLVEGKSPAATMTGAGVPIVMAAGSEQAASLLTGMQQAVGMTCGTEPNRLYDDALQEHMEWARFVCWSYGPAADDVDDARRESLANDVELIESIHQQIKPVVFAEDQQPDDFTQWGQEGVVKSSVDLNDTFITLPKRYAVRRNTRQVCRLKADLLENDEFGRVAPGVLEELDRRKGSWLERAGWASGLWNGGLGERVAGTIGGHMEKLGVDVGVESKVFDALLDGVDVPDESKVLFKNALTGGPPYSPRKEERLVFSLLQSGDIEGAMNLVAEDPALVEALNEHRRPVLAAVAQYGRAADVIRMVQLGADPRQVDGGGRHVLSDAAATATADCVCALLDCGADINGHDPLGWTPVLVALKRGRWEIAGLLAERGADVDWRGPTGTSAVDFVRGVDGAFGDATALMKKIGPVLGVDGDRFVKAMKRQDAFFTHEDVPPWLRRKIEDASRA